MSPRDGHDIQFSQVMAESARHLLWYAVGRKDELGHGRQDRREFGEQQPVVTP